METSLVGIGRETPHEQDWWPLVGGDNARYRIMGEEANQTDKSISEPPLGRYADLRPL
jgi:hypothetical protein